MKRKTQARRLKSALRKVRARKADKLTRTEHAAYYAYLREQAKWFHAFADRTPEVAQALRNIKAIVEVFTRGFSHPLLDRF